MRAEVQVCALAANRENTVKTSALVAPHVATVRKGLLPAN